MQSYTYMNIYIYEYIIIYTYIYIYIRTYHILCFLLWEAALQWSLACVPTKEFGISDP